MNHLGCLFEETSVLFYTSICIPIITIHEFHREFSNPITYPSAHFHRNLAICQEYKKFRKTNTHRLG